MFQVAGFETKEGCPITPGCHFQKMFTVLPHVNNKNKFGIALDGKVKVRVKCQVEVIVVRMVKMMMRTYFDALIAEEVYGCIKLTG